jgi:hypothetical protein
MKIYIENYDIDNLENKMPILTKYCDNCENAQLLLVYSDDGIFKINENKLQKMNIITDKVDRKQLSGFIIDRSKIIYENCNYLPYEHIFNKINQFIYKVNDKSKLKLVIEGTYIEQNNNLKFVPNDFYFETNLEEQIYNSVIKDDLNVFLSLLN